MSVSFKTKEPFALVYRVPGSHMDRSRVYQVLFGFAQSEQGETENFASNKNNCLCFYFYGGKCSIQLISLLVLAFLFYYIKKKRN